MPEIQKVTTSSGNIFADLGVANPEVELLRAKLVRENPRHHQAAQADAGQGRGDTWVEAAGRFSAGDGSRRQVLD